MGSSGGGGGGGGGGKGRGRRSRDNDGGGGGGGGGGGSGGSGGAGRLITVSKALSFLLRHGAQREGVRLDANGYARVDDVLAWNRLKRLGVSFDELKHVVRTNEKRRFRLIRDPATLPTASPSSSPQPPLSTSAAGATAASSAAEQAPADLAAEEEEEEANADALVTTTPAAAAAAAAASATQEAAKDRQANADNERKDDGVDDKDDETHSIQGAADVAAAPPAADIGDVDDPDPDPAHFLIRAAQGHSVAIAQETDLYTPLTPATAPPAVVHGTYRKAWPLILRSGGLKRMSRTHIHFAPAELPAVAAAYTSSGGSGGDDSVDDSAPPPLHPPSDQPGKSGKSSMPSSSSSPSRASGNPPAPAEEPPVVAVSGMRASAEISVYVDVRAAMRRAPAVRWWRAGNGVVLTAGDARTGVLPSELFSLAVLKADGRVLWAHGKPVDSL